MHLRREVARPSVHRSCCERQAPDRTAQSSVWMAIAAPVTHFAPIRSVGDCHRGVAPAAGADAAAMRPRPQFVGAAAADLGELARGAGRQAAAAGWCPQGRPARAAPYCNARSGPNCGPGAAMVCAGRRCERASPARQYSRRTRGRMTAGSGASDGARRTLLPPAAGDYRVDLRLLRGSATAAQQIFLGGRRERVRRARWRAQAMAMSAVPCRASPGCASCAAA